MSKQIRLRSVCIVLSALFAPSPAAFAGFNASAPPPVRRIFTELAFADGRLISYQVFEPGPAARQTFPVSSDPGMLLRFPGCPGLRPVLDDSAAPTRAIDGLVPDRVVREVVNVALPGCASQPKSVAEALAVATAEQGIGFVNAPGVPAPVGASVAPEEQQTAGELWGPVPSLNYIDFFMGAGLSPQHIQGKMSNGLPAAGVQQPDVRRPRIQAYSAGRVVYFVTYETKGLSKAGLVSADIESQWSQTGFPNERDIFVLSYGRAPLPPNAALPAGSLDSNGAPNDNQAVLNVAGGAPFINPGSYSPLWKMLCLDGGISPPIGPGLPCGSVRYYQIGQPRSVADLSPTGLPLVAGTFPFINCPVIASDVNNDGVFADTPLSREMLRFPDIDWDSDGIPDDGLHDANSTLR